jgi:3-hydroxyisobutyrate dehydrogenase-like beta-hydroxyacid dehydrogenase
MSPVHPARLGAPLLISGPHAEAAAEALGSVGFSRVSVVAGEVGRASAVKMIRSVMVKGIEALSAECVLAAASAGVVDAVLSSLDASPPPAAWAARVDYNLERMMAHGLRRASEMEQVVETLEALGDPAPMSRAAVERQRAIGRLGLSAAPPGLDDKIAAILGRREESAAV